MLKRDPVAWAVSAGLMLALLWGCSLSRANAKLAVGMEKENVLSLLGKPDQISDHGRYQVLRYNVRFLFIPFVTSAFVPLDSIAPYYVILRDEKVIRFGQGSILVTDNGDVDLVPFKRGWDSKQL